MVGGHTLLSIKPEQVLSPTVHDFNDLSSYFLEAAQPGRPSPSRAILDRRSQPPPVYHPAASRELAEVHRANRDTADLLFQRVTLDDVVLKHHRNAAENEAPTNPLARSG